MRVPKNAESSFFLFAVEESVVGLVNTDELMVLPNDLLFVVVIEKEMLHVIQEPSFWE